MYFIIDNKQGVLTILKSYEDKVHSMVNLIMLMKERGIRYYERQEDIKEDGTFCVRLTDTSYKIVKRFSEPDGYLLSGYETFSIVSVMSVVYYKDETFDFKDICKNIKVCSHTNKMKKVSKLDLLKK